MKADLNAYHREQYIEKIKLSSLVCLPPGCEQQSIKGILTITINIKYLDAER